MIFQTCWPRKIKFRTGGVITCLHRNRADAPEAAGHYKTMLFDGCGGYAAFLGPVAGIMICDYFVIRGLVLVVDDLYLRDGAYRCIRRLQLAGGGCVGSGAGTASVGW